jgi:hypothetical protein
MASQYTRGSVTTLQHEFGGVLGRHLDTFLSGTHNYMVTALSLCVKWPLLHGMTYPKTRTKVWVPIQIYDSTLTFQTLVILPPHKNGSIPYT